MGDPGKKIKSFFYQLKSGRKIELGKDDQGI